jgi:transcriptional regulator with XRE-family HTH domain
MRASNTLVLIMKNRRVNGRKLSELTGISRSAISQIVNGRLLPTDDELEKICSVLEVTPAQIYPIAEMRQVLRVTPEEEGEVLEDLGGLKMIAGGSQQVSDTEASGGQDNGEALKQPEEFECDGSVE